MMAGKTLSNWTNYFYVIIPIGFIVVSISMYPFMLLPMTAPLKKKFGKNAFIGINVAVVFGTALFVALFKQSFPLSDLNDLNG